MYVLHSVNWKYKESFLTTKMTSFPSYLQQNEITEKKTIHVAPNYWDSFHIVYLNLL